MKYSFLFGIISIITIIYIFQYPNTWIILGWIAVSSIIVSIAYAGILPKAFFKKNGIIPLWSKLLNFPFLLFSNIIWHLYRIINKEDSSNKISDSLIIGRRLLLTEINFQVTYYIDLTAEFDEPKKIRRQKSYLCFPILDGGVPEIDKLIQLLFQIDNKKVYIHCAQGHGRTGLVTLALLLKNGTINDIDSGILFLQKFRPALNLNLSQIEYLKKHQQNIRSK